MAEINHRVGIAGTPEEVYLALTTDEGLAKWWTWDVTGAGDVGAVIKFRFHGQGPDFKVAELQPGALVRWQHHGDVPEAWRGTEISFRLASDGTQTFVRFSHANWQESSDFLAHCSTKWAVFLLSLKSVIETGRGHPFPDDVHIDHSE